METVIRALWKCVEAVLKGITRFIFRIVGKRLTAEEWDGHAEFWKFAVIGCSSTLVQYVVYVLILAAMGRGHYLLASIISFLCSTVYSFYCNNRYVFPESNAEKRQTKGSILRSFLKTLMTYSVTGFVLYNVLMVMFIDALGVSELVAPIIILVICFPINFLLNKFWAFGGKPKKKKKKKNKNTTGAENGDSD